MTSRGLVLYPAFEQLFFVESIVFLLFRAAAHFRRLHSALDRHMGSYEQSAPFAQRCLAPYRGPESAECITRYDNPSWTCGMSAPDSAQGDRAVVAGQPWTS
jgi:hypothetical protein